MKSTWSPTATDAIALTTDRGPSELDAAFIARHEAAVAAALAGAVAPEDLEEVVDEHFLDFTDLLLEDGDGLTKEVDLTP